MLATSTKPRVDVRLNEQIVLPAVGIWVSVCARDVVREATKARQCCESVSE